MNNTANITQESNINFIKFTNQKIHYYNRTVLYICIYKQLEVGKLLSLTIENFHTMTAMKTMINLPWILIKHKSHTYFFIHI